MAAATTRPTLNPRFAARKDGIREEILLTLRQIETPLKNVAVALGEFQDYVGFEIAKVELALERGDGDPVELKSWLSTLQMAQALFPPSAADDTTNNLRDLNELLRDKF